MIFQKSVPQIESIPGRGEFRENLPQTLVARLNLRLLFLKAYAKIHGIPKKVDPPSAVSINMDEDSIQSKDYRHYMVRRAITLAEETVNQTYLMNPEDLSEFYQTRILQQQNTLTRLLNLLSTVYE